MIVSFVKRKERKRLIRFSQRALKSGGKVFAGSSTDEHSDFRSKDHPKPIRIGRLMEPGKPNRFSSIIEEQTFCKEMFCTGG